MDEELRKAQRNFQRAAGGDELGILSLYYEQIRDYLHQQGLPLLYGGVGRDIYHLRKLHPETSPSRNMSSRQIHFLHYADLDTKSPEEILKECCCHASWSDWFDMVSYYQVFVSKKVGSCLWSQVLDIPGDKAKDWDAYRKGTTYKERLQASFDEWSNYAISCMLGPKYVNPDRPPERWHNWTAQLILVGYGKKT